MLFWSLRTVDGRCRIQAWPWLSIETLETWPHTHLLGSFGHDGSTSKCGIMRGGCGACAEAVATWPESAMTATNAMKVERVFACIGNPRSHIWISHRGSHPMPSRMVTEFSAERSAAAKGIRSGGGVNGLGGERAVKRACAQPG